MGKNSRLTTNLISLETKVPVVIPPSSSVAQAKVISDVREGMRIELMPGTAMFELHNMLAEGLVLEISFTYKPAEAASK